MKFRKRHIVATIIMSFDDTVMVNEAKLVYNS